MTTAIAIIVLLALIVGASKLFQHWLDSYLKDDMQLSAFDQAQAKRDVEELLKAANKAPKKRAF